MHSQTSHPRCKFLRRMWGWICFQIVFNNQMLTLLTMLHNLLVSQCDFMSSNDLLYDPKGDWDAGKVTKYTLKQVASPHASFLFWFMLLQPFWAGCYIEMKFRHMILNLPEMTLFEGLIQLNPTSTEGHLCVIAMEAFGNFVNTGCTSFCLSFFHLFELWLI